MSEDRPQIAFEQLGIGSVLSRYHLSVQAHQREYAWRDKEVTELFQDLAKAIDDDEPIYFLGAIVTIPLGDARLQIVDGQQRLATTSLFLAAIRNYLRASDPMIADSIDHTFISTIDRGRRLQVPKLSLNLDDNEYFRALITTGSGDYPAASSHPSHQLLRAAAEQAREYVTRIVAGHHSMAHGDVLNRWVNYIEHRALAILRIVPSGANAYRMFETLNDRGRRTTQADLVKNYLFGRSGERLNEVQQKWSNMRGSLDTLEDTDITIDFLRHVIIARRGYIREHEIYDCVQEFGRGEQATIYFMSLLESLAITYVSIFNPDHERWNRHGTALRQTLAAINLLNVAPMRPLILAAAAKIEGDGLLSVLRLILSLSARLLLARRTRTGAVEQALATAAAEVFGERIRTKEALAAELALTIPTDSEFREIVANATVTKAKFARYYLRAMELCAQGETQPWLLPNDNGLAINLEHVLPTRPEINWPHFDDDLVRLYCHRLGNLALIRASSNTDLSNKAFSDKVLVYKDSPYLLTHQIAEAKQWTPEAIRTRQRYLADLAAETWPI